MVQLSLFSKTNKKNKMAVKKTKKKPTKKTTYASKITKDAKKKLSSVKSSLSKAGYSIKIVKKGTGGSPIKYSGKASKGNYRYKYVGGKK